MRCQTLQLTEQWRTDTSSEEKLAHIHCSHTGRHMENRLCQITVLMDQSYRHAYLEFNRTSHGWPHPSMMKTGKEVCENVRAW